MKKIIVIANQKGGVGKTTMSINLSVALAGAGRRVLLVDLDPQGNSTSGLGIRKNLEKTVYDVLIRGSSVWECVQESGYQNLDVLPANMNLAGASIELAGMDFREFLLKKGLDAVRARYDFILMDTPPSLGLLTVNAFVAADQILIPMQCEYFALEGVSQLVKVYESIRNFANPRLEILGVVLSMVDFRNKLTDAVAGEIKTFFNGKVLNSVIPRNVRMAEAPSFGKPIQSYAPESKGAVAINNLVEELLRGTYAQVPDELTTGLRASESSSNPSEYSDIKTVTNGGNYEEGSIREGTVGIDSDGEFSIGASIPAGGEITDSISVSINRGSQGSPSSPATGTETGGVSGSDGSIDLTANRLNSSESIPAED